jgi:hypothetical protein
VEQTSATTPPPAAPGTIGAASQSDAAGAEPAPGFAARGRLRRRVRFLRKARELAYRDLGGLVFNLHRFGQRNDELVLAKLSTLGQIDTELRALEASLEERQPVTVLREAGITACPRCAAIHGSEDRFCPNCGLPMSRHVDLPIAGAPSAPAPASPAGPPAAVKADDGQGKWSPSPAGPPGPAPGRPAAPRAPTPPASASAQRSGEAPPQAPASVPVPSAAPPAGAAVPPAEQPAAAPQAAPPPGPVQDAAAPSGDPAPHGRDEEPTEIVRPRSGSA